MSVSSLQNKDSPKDVESGLTIDQLEHAMNVMSVEEVADSVQISRETELELNREFRALLRDFGHAKHFPMLFPELRPKSLSQHVRKSDGAVQGNESLFPYLLRTSKTDPYSSQEMYLRRKKHQRSTGLLGADVHDVYRPHLNTLTPPSINRVSVATLMAAGAHLGHSVSLFRASTQPYICGKRDGIHIIDLDQTLAHLLRAAKVLERIAENAGLIVYVGTRKGQERGLELAAERSGGYYVHTRWVPGTLTNGIVISSPWERLEVDMGDKPTQNELSAAAAGGVIKPDIVVLLNPTENRTVINECILARIPTIGLIDTDSEPSLVTYPIPGNDDSLRATDLIVGVLSKAAERGKKRRISRFIANEKRRSRD